MLSGLVHVKSVCGFDRELDPTKCTLTVSVVRRTLPAKFRLKALFARSVMVRFLDPRRIGNDKDVDIGNCCGRNCSPDDSSCSPKVVSSHVGPPSIHLVEFDLVFALIELRVDADLLASDSSFVRIWPLGFRNSDIPQGMTDFDLSNVFASDRDPIERSLSELLSWGAGLRGGDLIISGTERCRLSVGFFRSFPSSSNSSMSVVSEGGAGTFCLLERTRGWGVLLPTVDGRCFIIVMDR